MYSSILPLICLAIIVIMIILLNTRTEGFDAVGLIFNEPSEWFHKTAYDPNDWLVHYEPDYLEQATGCDSNYKGNPEFLKWQAGTTRFWRM
jgi:hypothetical protein